MTRLRRASFALAPAFRMTCASPREMPNAEVGSIRASMQVRTAYFFAGGRARCPSVKLDAYFSFDLTRFSWMGVGAIVWIGSYQVLESGLMNLRVLLGLLVLLLLRFYRSEERCSKAGISTNICPGGST